MPANTHTWTDVAEAAKRHTELTIVTSYVWGRYRDIYRRPVYVGGVDVSVVEYGKEEDVCQPS